MIPYVILVLMIISYFLNSLATKRLDRLIKQTSKSTLSGDDIAKRILGMHHIRDVGIKRMELTGDDYYNPVDKSIQLGPDVYGSKTVYALAIGSHEAAHAIDYQYLRYLNAPLSKLKKFIFLPLFILAFFIASPVLHNTVLWLFVFLVLFKFFVEILDEIKTNKRASKALSEFQMISTEELKETKKIFRRMNFTYITGILFVLL